MEYDLDITREREIKKMKKLLKIGILSILFCAHHLSLAQPRSDSRKIGISSATLLMLSIELAQQANQLFIIKDNLLQIVQERKGDLTVQEKYIVDVVSELKHIATIAYFESKLLGVVLLLREDLKLPFVNARIPELEESIKSTESSLQPVQIAYSSIQSHEALQQVDQAIEILKSLNRLYKNGIDILQKTRLELGAEGERTQPRSEP